MEETEIESSSCLSFHILETLYKEGKIGKARKELYQQKFSQLAERIKKTVENEKVLLVRAKELNTELTAERMRLEKTAAEATKNSTTIAQLQEELRKKKMESDTVGDMLEVQRAECEHEKRELEQLLETWDNNERAAQQPVIDAANEQIDLIQKEMAKKNADKERYQQQADVFAKRIETLEAELQELKLEKAAALSETRKVVADPERAKRQADKFDVALTALKAQRDTAEQDMAQAVNRLAQLTAKRKEQEETLQLKELKLKADREAVMKKEQSKAEAQAQLRGTIQETVGMMELKASLELQLKQATSESRSMHEELSKRRQHHERSKRDVQKVENIVASLSQTLEPVIQQQTDALRHKKEIEDERKANVSLKKEIESEVDWFIGAYLRQEAQEKDKKEEYAAIGRHISELQAELQGLKRQDVTWNQHFKFLGTQREKLARECSVAIRSARDTWAEVQMKALEEIDLTKRLHEGQLQQKEFGTLYQVVKNERNKYVTHIQASEQHIAEMKERQKILQNEVEILKTESLAKDRSLGKVRSDTQKLREERDRLRSDYARASSKAADLNDEVEQLVVSIDKLNSIINQIEREMLSLKRGYETAIERRNFTGILLIDRNDELCILWEKANMQEKLLQSGHCAANQEDESARVARIALEEVSRRLNAERKKIPRAKALVEEARQLKEELDEVRKTSDQLSLEFENPSSEQRKWRQLEGEDPDTDALQARIQLLEDRLKTQKETILEKELILEEITSFSDKLRKQAVGSRESTLNLSQRVNNFQQRLKEVTRQMMATVSELSMYQATALKLTQDKEDLSQQVEMARECLSRGEPPFPGADAEFEKQIAIESQREALLASGKMRKKEEEELASQATRTTAEQRVNAYIPDPELGIPKAYGSSAPFMPSVGGSSMRHTRKPNPKPVEL